METLIIVIIAVEIIKTVIDIVVMNKRHQRNEVYQRNIQGNYEFFAEFQERVFETFKAGNANTVKEIKEQNNKLYAMFESDFMKEIEKADQKKADAQNALNLYITAIKSLDPNDRKKIQFRLDRILNRPKPQPVKSDKNKPEKGEK